MRIRGVENCEQCGASDYLTVDHIIPKSFLKHFGLQDHADDRRNLQVLCDSCNLVKDNWIDLTTYRKTIDRILDMAQKKQENEKEMEKAWEEL